MLVEADDFAPPFSAPNLRHICMRNCGEASLGTQFTCFTSAKVHILTLCQYVYLRPIAAKARSVRLLSLDILDKVRRFST